MGIGKRLLDLARANLNALLERAAGDTPIGDLTDEELEAELERRKLRKVRELEEQKVRESAERAARERAAQRRVGGNTDPRNAASQKKPPPRGAASQQKSRPRTPPPPGSERRLRELYQQLEVPYGAPFEEVKRSFRRLMRKYHPDLHVNDPVKHKAATQLTMSLNAAYNELERYLEKK